MEWTDEGIVLGVRRHGETHMLAELMTAQHGRHLGNTFAQVRAQRFDGRAVAGVDQAGVTCAMHLWQQAAFGEKTPAVFVGCIALR